MRKKSLMVIMILIAIFAVGIVVAQDDLDSVDPSGVNILYWHEWDRAQQEGIDEVIRLFEESNEYGITVEDISLGSTGPLLDAMSTAIVSGELPNLSGAAFDNVAMGWYMDDVLVTLDDYMESDMWGLSDDEMAALNQDILNINRPSFGPFAGQLLVMPIGMSGDVMTTNLDFLAEMNSMGVIDFEGAPQTPEQFRAAACGASQVMSPDGETPVKGFAMRGSSFELQDFIYNFGGDVFDAEAGEYNFTNDGAIEAMQFVQDLFNDGCSYFPEGGTYSNTAEFSLGLNTFALGSSVGVPFIQGDMDNAGLDYNWVNVPPPSTEGNTTIVPSVRSIGIIDSTPEENLATWLFVKFWATNPEAQVAWVENAQYQPFNFETQGNLSEEFLSSSGNEKFNAFGAILVDPEVSMTSAPGHPRYNDINDVIAELYANITLGGMDVMEAAEEANEEANEIYEEMLEDLEG